MNSNDDCKFYLNKIIIDCIQFPDSRQEVKKSNFICLLYDLAEQYKKALNQKSDDKKISLSLLIEYINKHYDSITLESLAQKFHYASASMSRYIKQQTGRTFSDIVRSIRLKNAYYLLSYTNLSIEEIADKLGYHERSYFEKIFKQYCGITPAEYRKKHTTLKKFNTI